MAKIDLKKSSGFSIQIEQGALISSDLKHEEDRHFSIDDIRPQLLNDALSYPHEFYSKYYKLDHDELFDSRNFRLNLYIIPPNLAGIEYVKTRALRASNNRILEVWYGGGTLIMQNDRAGNDDVIISKMKRDDKAIIPAGFAASIVNTRQSMLVVAEILPKGTRTHIVLDDMNGMAYYVIRKNAKQEIVRNPLYKDVEKFRRVKWENIVQEYGITLKTPVIKQILRKNDKFSWFFQESKIEV